MDQKLSYPDGYLALTPEQKSQICNGCGGKNMPGIIPDCILGANVEESCNIHDFGYSLGQDKRLEDRRFLFNLLSQCECENNVEFLARAEIAFKYFEAVTIFGHPFFGVQS